MAEKISAANTIQIDVIDYGLEKPLENSLEISLFRIIQELTTNIIKHAQANHATINISQDEEDITILIEDNGIGMNTSQIDLQKGMGLHSIKTRVAHLDGSFTIDSTLTKGTTIIINTPI
jgi:signal transduction histidine kinase